MAAAPASPALITTTAPTPTSASSPGVPAPIPLTLPLKESAARLAPQDVLIRDHLRSPPTIITTSSSISPSSQNSDTSIGPALPPPVTGPPSVSAASLSSSVSSDRSASAATSPSTAAWRASLRTPRGPTDFKYGQVLGEGSFSTVVEAWDLLSEPRAAAAAAATAASVSSSAPSNTLSASSSYSSLRNRSRASSSASIGAAVAAAASGLSSPVLRINGGSDSNSSSSGGGGGGGGGGGRTHSPETAAAAIVRGNSTLDTTNKRVYAIKILHKGHIIKEKKSKYVGYEKEALSRLTRAPGIITLYWTFQDPGSLYFVLALAPNGELLSHIKTLGSFSLTSTRFYAAQLLDAIRSIHEAGIIHRDIKPENILFDKEMRIKVTDFGSVKILTPSASTITSAQATQNSPLSLATVVDTPASGGSATARTGSPTPRPALLRNAAGAPSQASSSSSSSSASSTSPLTRRPPPPPPSGSSSSSTPSPTALPQPAGGAGEKPGSFVGTAEYVAPELLTSRAVSFASDWWAYGCIVFQMLSGRPPFKGPTEYQTFQRILHREMEWPAHLDDGDAEGGAESRHDRSGSSRTVNAVAADTADKVEAQDAAERRGFAEARRLIDLLLVLDPEQRLGWAGTEGRYPVEDPQELIRAGSRGANAVRSHPFFDSVSWSTLWTGPVPALEAGKVPPKIPAGTPMSQLEYEFGEAAFFEDDIEEEEEEESGNSSGNGSDTDADPRGVMERARATPLALR